MEVVSPHTSVAGPVYARAVSLTVSLAMVLRAPCCHVLTLLFRLSPTMRMTGAGGVMYPNTACSLITSATPASVSVTSALTSRGYTPILRAAASRFMLGYE